MAKMKRKFDKPKKPAVVKAEKILALPLSNTPPKAIKAAVVDKWWVCQWRGDAQDFYIAGPTRDSEAEAIKVWNAAVKKVLK